MKFKIVLALVFMASSSAVFSADLIGASNFLSRMCSADVKVSVNGEIKIIGKKSWGTTHNFKFNVRDVEYRDSYTAGGFPRIICKGEKKCMTTLETEDVSGFVEKPPVHTFSDTVQILTCDSSDGRLDRAFSDLFVHFNGRPKKATIYD